MKYDPIWKVAKNVQNKWNLVQHYMEPIFEYFIDPEVTEIMINGFDNIFIENNKGKIKTDATFENEENLMRLIRQLSIALRQDKGTLGVLHARLPDQSRACCTSTLITPTGASITIRCAPKTVLTFDDLVKYKSLTQEMADYIKVSVNEEKNAIISGSTGSGKTTILRAMAGFIAKDDRVIVCEDTQELGLKLPNVIAMEAPKREGSEINLSYLIETTLRQRPDRVIVGEIRDASACDAFLQVINTGHDGCLTSIHANNPAKAIRRIQYLLSKEGMIDFEMAGVEVKESINLFIQTKRTKHGKRITEITILNEDGEMVKVFGYDQNNDLHFKV
ncbi:MAG: CpaF family protein [Gammaproteobacteria bacterium]|nr:CpaF family protein [Gammaproteobacteria bacterium]